MIVVLVTVLGGAAMIMAHDLAATPRSGLNVQCCGDAHLPTDDSSRGGDPSDPWQFTDCGTRCPSNAMELVGGHAATGAALITAYSVMTTIGLVGLAMLIFHKARSSSHLRRRAIGPLAVVFIANIVEFLIELLVLPAYPGTRETLKIANGLVTLALPLALFVGQVRGNVFAATSLGQIAVRASGKPLDAEAVQKMIGDALGDSTMALAPVGPRARGLRRRSRCAAGASTRHESARRHSRHTR